MTSSILIGLAGLVIGAASTRMLDQLRAVRRRRRPPLEGFAPALFLDRHGSKLWGQVAVSESRVPTFTIVDDAGDLLVGRIEPASTTPGRSHVVYREARLAPFVIGDGSPRRPALIRSTAAGQP